MSHFLFAQLDDSGKRNLHKYFHSIADEPSMNEHRIITTGIMWAPVKEGRTVTQDLHSSCYKPGRGQVCRDPAAATPAEGGSRRDASCRDAVGSTVP